MSPSRLTAEIWPITDAGQAESNQDYVLVYHPGDEQQARYAGSLYVVADGEGGGQQGQLASRYAAQKVMHVYYSSDEPDLGLRLREAVLAANADLFEYARQRPELVKLSTTFVAAVLRGEQMHVASVGDSRAYLVRDGQIRQITRDHTLVQQLLEEGAITPEEAREHPRRDVVLRTIGAQAEVTVDIVDLRLRPDDVIVLCTDGLTQAVRDDEIALVASSMSPRDAAEELIQRAKERGGKDNITLVAGLVRDGAPLEVEVPHTWDGLPPSFEAQPALAVPRAVRPEPPAPPTEPSQPTEHLAETVRARRITSEEAAADAWQEAAPTAPEGLPAPPYQQPVQPAPPYGAPAQGYPAPQPPSPRAPYPPQPYGPRGAPGGSPSPPGYAIDPVTGLPPVPPQPAQPGQAPGWTGPQPAGGYAPRIYQPPAQPNLRVQRRGGISLGAFAVVGLIAIIMTALMVVILVNPMGWTLPFIGGGEEEATSPVVGQPVTQAALTQPVVAPPSTAAVTPTPSVEPSPTTPVTPPGMVYIDGGPFTRGVTDEEAQAAALACINETVDDPQRRQFCRPENFGDAKPVEEITLSAFFIDLTEVTNQAYAGCVAAGVCTPPENVEFYDDPNFAQHPVVYVTYEQATQYCQWAGKRLPTEAEWEKAARWDPASGASYVYPWGNTFEVGRANTLSAGLGGLSAVQAFPRDLSPSGVLGMAGNAREWVQDWYFGNYDGLGTLNPVRLGTQPLPVPARAARGGSYQDLDSMSRAGHRFDVNAVSAAPWLSFRCVAEVAGAAPPAAPTDETPVVVPTPTPTNTPVP